MNAEEINELKAAVRAVPSNIQLRKILAKALLENGSFTEAEVEYKEAIAMAPNDSALKLGLARTFLLNDKLGAAIILLEEMKDLSFEQAPYWKLLATVQLERGMTEDAREAYERAVDLDPMLSDPELKERILDAQAAEKEPEREKLLAGGPTELEEVDLLMEDMDIERPKVDFKDVGGMDRLKEEIRMKIILPLEQPELYKAYGKKVGGGILMYGPPGCGKTFLARATAGEIRANFFSVGLNDILDMYIGQSEQNLHEIFQKARANTPAVLFFDEVDALGASRSDMRQSAGRHVINQFLSELDGVQYSNEGVLILGATNTPWHLDTAFRRPGRFDRILFVPPPDAQGRAEIYKLKLEGKPVGRLDFKKLAAASSGFSGADIESVIDKAVEIKLDQAMRSGKVEAIETADLLKAAKNHKPSTKEWLATAKNYAAFANSGGLYDDILKYLDTKEKYR